MAIGQPAEVAVDLLEREKRGGWHRAALEFARARPLDAIGAAIRPPQPRDRGRSLRHGRLRSLATDYAAMLARPSATHWLGTDACGRDVLSRIISGSRTAILVGFACPSWGSPSAPCSGCHLAVWTGI